MSHPSVVVIGSQFCSGYPVNLTIRRKLITLSEKFRVTDVDGNVIFKLRESKNFFSYHKRRVLLDAAGNRIITLQNKIMSRHHRWKVFRGDSTDEKDMLFSVRKSSSSLLRKKAKFRVFLASNTREKVWDFKIKGKWSNGSCVVYAGKSKNVIARMKRNNIVQTILFGRDSFGVRVYPHVDYAFVVSLIAILREIYEDRVKLFKRIRDEISSA